MVVILQLKVLLLSEMLPYLLQPLFSIVWSLSTDPKNMEINSSEQKEIFSFGWKSVTYTMWIVMHEEGVNNATIFILFLFFFLLYACMFNLDRLVFLTYCCSLGV